MDSTLTNKTVSLVLGSGGARGLAHIGIIEWLQAHDYEIKSIAGSSMGALVGGIYAAGKLDVYSNWVQALQRTDVLRLLDLSFRSGGLFKGERVINVLKELIGDFQIEELPISYTAVATDLDSGKEVWLSKGPLFDAIRASIAIPTILTPHTIDGRLLVDGGLVNPVPIAPTLHDVTDVTIAVNLSGIPDPTLLEPENKAPTSTQGVYQRRVQEFVELLQSKVSLGTSDDNLGLLEVITRSFETMQATVARLKLAAHFADAVITIPRNSCRFFEFYRASEMIEFGREKAEEVIGKGVTE
ncbi:MAG: patatin-like phospholipase family protein [Gammaproteobacteria bacterium]|nr:patatin-like phospholipase family protein [Gammaproteobacteria bacterium]